MKLLNPSEWTPPVGYSNGIAARGKLVFVAGQIGWNAKQEFESDDFAAQTEQALQNTVAVLREAGADPAHIARMTWYVLDCAEYRAAAQEIGGIYKRIIGKHYPAMTLVQVAALLEPRARVEIETTAVIPD